MDTKGGKLQWGGDGGVLNWVIGIDIYTLIYIKWITNKNLLYKNINKIKFKKKEGHHKSVRSDLLSNFVDEEIKSNQLFFFLITNVFLFCALLFKPVRLHVLSDFACFPGLGNELSY